MPAARGCSGAEPDVGPAEAPCTACHSESCFVIIEWPCETAACVPTKVIFRDVLPLATISDSFSICTLAPEFDCISLIFLPCLPISRAIRLFWANISIDSWPSPVSPVIGPPVAPARLLMCCETEREIRYCASNLARVDPVMATVRPPSPGSISEDFSI